MHAPVGGEGRPTPPVGEAGEGVKGASPARPKNRTPLQGERAKRKLGEGVKGASPARPKNRTPPAGGEGQPMPPVGEAGEGVNAAGKIGNRR